MYGLQASAFVRYPFVVSNSADVAQILLSMKFDDGFAAWLNGTLVATNNTPASLAWNSYSAANRSDSLALVFQDYTLDTFAHLLVEGTNVLALQALNTSLTSSDLLLMSELKLTWAPSTADVSRAVGYFSVATPGNANSVVLPGVVSAPAFSPPGGVFAGPLSVTVTV